MLTTGRKMICTRVKKITRENVVKVIGETIGTFNMNKAQINYLYDYYRGIQPVLNRVKKIRPEICNKIVENRALEIVSFKTAYICGEPIQYVSRDGKEENSDYVSLLNSYMAYESKETKDKELFDWQHICGTSYRMITPSETADDETPFDIITVDPRECYVIYSADIKHRRLAGVLLQMNEDGEQYYSVFTDDSYFEIKNSTVINERSPLTQAAALAQAKTLEDVDWSQTGNYLGIPIIEYPANNARMGAFEPIKPLLEAINELDSSRIDGVSQFIQSLIVLYNCQLPDNTDKADIREKGIIELASVSENKADIKILSEQLNQTETQTLKDDLYRSVLTIVGMPSQSDGSTSDSSNNGAVIMRNGWTQAESRAKDSEMMFKLSEKEMLRYVLKIIKAKNEKFNLNLIDIDYRFTRRQYDALLTKAQVLTTLLATDKVAPRLCFNVCGLFIDPEEAAKESAEYIESISQKENVTVVDEFTETETDVLNDE